MGGVEHTEEPPPVPCSAELRALLMDLRQARLIELAAYERYLGLSPSRPKRERPEKVRAWRNEDAEAYRTA